MNVSKLFGCFQRLDVVDNHPLLAAVDDFCHLFGGREVFSRKRFAQFRGKTAVVSGDPLPFRGNQPGCAQRFEQQRQQLVVRRLQRFCELAGQQSGKLLFGRVAFEDADSVEVFGQHCDLPVGQARAEIGGCRVEAVAAALGGPAFFGLGQQLRFALLALYFLRLPMTGVVGDFGNGRSDFGNTGHQFVRRGICRITGGKILERLVDAALLFGRDGTVGEPTVVFLLFAGDVSASFGSGQVAMFDFALDVNAAKSGCP